MSELIKTTAIVIRKIDYGDSSKIATLFSPQIGKFSVIVKGGRTKQSKVGSIVDILNHIEIVYYTKKSREIQIISQTDLINGFRGIKENLEKLKYASAIIELLDKLTVEEYHYDRLFRGVIKILSHIDSGESLPKLYFLKYFLFFLKEIGYDFQFDDCTFCGKELITSYSIKYNHEFGMMCNDCSKDRLFSYEFSQELFESLVCLSQRENNKQIKENNIDKLILFLERYLMYHIDVFKGLKSLQIL